MYRNIIKNKKVGMLAIVVLSFIVMINISSSFMSKEKAIITLKDVYDNKDAALLRTILPSEEMKYSDQELQAFIEYLHSHESDFRTFIDKLHKYASDENLNHQAFSIVSEKKYGLFNNYVLHIKPFQVTLRTEKNIYAVEWNEHSLPIGEKILMIPSVLYVNLHIENEYGSFIEKQKVNLDPTHRSDHFYVDLKAKNYVKIKSNFHSSILYINGENTGKQIGYEGQVIGPMPLDGSVSVAVGKTFPWGEFVSESIPVVHKKHDLYLDAKNEHVETKLREVMTEYIHSIVLAWQVEDSTLIKHASQVRKNIEKNLMKFDDIPRVAKLLEFTVEELHIVEDYRYSKYGIGAYIYAKEKYDYDGKMPERFTTYGVYFDEEEKKWIVVSIQMPLYSFIREYLYRNNNGE